MVFFRMARRIARQQDQIAFKFGLNGLFDRLEVFDKSQP
jgi:hypothetical protein